MPTSRRMKEAKIYTYIYCIYSHDVDLIGLYIDWWCTYASSLATHVSLLPRIEMHADQTVDFAQLSRNLSSSLRCSFWVHVKNASRALKSKSLKNNLNGDPALAAIVLCIYINNIYKYILVDWEKERKRGSRRCRLAHRERKKEKKKGKKKKEGKADEQEAGRNTKWRHDVPCLLNRSSSLSLCTVPYTRSCACVLALFSVGFLYYILEFVLVFFHRPPCRAAPPLNRITHSVRIHVPLLRFRIGRYPFSPPVFFFGSSCFFKLASRSAFFFCLFYVFTLSRHLKKKDKKKMG